MRITKICILLISCFIFHFQLSAQNQKMVDSLVEVYHSKKNTYNNDSVFFNLLYEISYYHYNPDTALKFANELIKYAQNKSDHFFLYRGLLQKGNVLCLKGNYEDAVKALFRCASEARKMNYSRGIGCAYVAIGDIYLSTEDHGNALKYYNQAIQIFRNLNDSSVLANALFNAGSEYLFINNTDSALAYFNASESIYIKLNHKIGIAYSLGNKGLVFLQSENYGKAEKNLLSAIEMLKDLNDMYPVASYQRALAKLYKAKGDNDKAIDFALSSYDLASKYGLKQPIRDACEILSDIYSSTGNFKEALDYHLEFIAYRDSIINEETIRKVADLRTEFEVSQKQAEVDLLKKKRQTQVLISAGLALVTLLIGTLGIVLYVNNKRKQKLNIQLAEQKEEMETQRDQLVELNNTKDRFFSIISHDLRGPISTLHGFSIILKEYISNGNIKSLSELADDLNASINKVSSLLDNLLDWALSQQGRFPYTPVKVNLSEIIHEIIMNSSHMAMSKDIDILCNPPESLMVWADKNSLMTILRNLLNNAIKFSYKDSKIEIFAGKLKKYAEIRVKDYGVGIPKEKISDLFKLKGDKSTWGTAKEKGVGLGLSIAYDFITMNKGTINVESEVGKGTTFILKIPLEKPVE